MVRVAAIELPARWGEPHEALADADRLLARGPACDVVLLPEAALTGYVSPQGDADLRRFAEPMDGPTTRALADLARAHGTCVAGPLIERDGARFYNVLVVVDAAGRMLARYRKRHPWFPETWAAPGDEPLPQLEIAGAQFTACICFDLHFIAEESSDALRAADVLLFPSAWVEEGEDSRPRLFAELARAYGIATVNANWGVGSPQMPGQGGTMIVSARGDVIARISSEAGGARRIDAVIGCKPRVTSSQRAGVLPARATRRGTRHHQ